MAKTRVPMILIHTALMREAKSLIAALRLKPVPLSCSFRVFASDQHALLVSGPGRVRAAAAIGFLLGQSSSPPDKPPAFLLNVGVCGSAGAYPFGQLFLVRKCIEASSGRTFYPDLLLSHRLPEADLRTFDHVVDSHDKLALETPEACLVDMEAAGVFETGALFLPPSRVLSVKVVGDHLDDARSVTPSSVEERIECALPEISRLVETCRSFATDSASPPLLGPELLGALTRLEETLKLTNAQRDRLRNAGCYRRLVGESSLLEDLRPFFNARPRHKRERDLLFRKLLHALHGE